MDLNEKMCEQVSKKVGIEKISKRTCELINILAEDKITQIIQNSIKYCNTKTLLSEHIYEAIKLDNCFMGKH